MPEKSLNTELEMVYESFPRKGSVRDLVQALLNCYYDVEPDPQTGYINLLGRRETWKIGVRLPEGLKIGTSYGFWPALHKANLTWELESGSISQSLDPDQEIRWQTL